MLLSASLGSPWSIVDDDWICAPFCRDGFMALDGDKGAWDDDDAGTRLIDEGKLDDSLGCFCLPSRAD